MKNGQTVAAFEREFASYVNAKYAIALCNGTATLHTALVALGVKPNDKVAVPPLTMSATAIAVLQAGAVPVFVDVDPNTWLMDAIAAANVGYQIPVSLYGLNYPYACRTPLRDPLTIDDAAQTLRKHDTRFAFTSFSFQASKILALGEGGMLVTDSEELATKAREFSSLGYRMRADQPRIDPDALKSPTFDRHYSLGWNYRMNDLTAAEGLRQMEAASVLVDDVVLPGVRVPLARVEFPNGLDALKAVRQLAAKEYRDAIKGCSWIVPQHTPEGWSHDQWSFAVTLSSPELWTPLKNAIAKNGGEPPYASWKLTYTESAFAHLAPKDGCPVAESLQPRIMAFQTNRLDSAERNAKALRAAIEELS